jgi:FixJ family two-component response regulator
MSNSLAIAVVDDEAPVRKALGRLLRAAGFSVETFASGIEFLGSLQIRRPDCTILDLHLPGLSGLEVQEQLARDKNSLPCIVITGKDEPGVAERVRAAGASAYLKKPLDERVLLAAISSAVPQFARRKLEPRDLEQREAVLINQVREMEDENESEPESPISNRP